MLDHIKSVNTPNLHRLMAEGTTGSSSILGHPTISAPSWSTILTGVWNTKHGVQDNSFAGARYDQYPSAFAQIERTEPTRRTAAILTWGGIATVAGSGSPKADVLITTPNAGSEAATDTATATAVASEIAASGPDFVFTQLDQVDGAGHWTGTSAPRTTRPWRRSTSRSAGSLLRWTSVSATPASGGPCWSPPTTVTCCSVGTAVRPPTRHRLS
ncbi:alkaline phosphatase family protein [Rhodococcus oryzae]|uniref:alkaline phosphatase family protein n=1 Tax=Rhodococcus oryzae TaxID=2571143 RepID=UPI003717AF9B